MVGMVVTTSEVVEARELVRVYGEGDTAVQALRGVDVQIEAGQLTAVMGPSGSGKSTLMHILAGLDRPTSGSVVLDDVEITKLDDRKLTELRRERVGFVFQSFNLLPVLDARENIVLPLSIAGKRPDPEWLDTLITTVGLGDRLDHRPSELSGGQQQRVAVARALVAEPDVILADEPIAEVDSENADLILSALWEVVVRDGAVLAATHNPEALRYANRVLLFRDGMIEAEGTPDEVAAKLTTD